MSFRYLTTTKFYLRKYLNLYMFNLVKTGFLHWNQETLGNSNSSWLPTSVCNICLICDKNY